MAQTYSAAFARGFLRKLWRSAQASGQELKIALEAASDDALVTVEGGKILVGTAANGRTASFSIDGLGLTPRDVVELTSRLLDRYDNAVAYLGNTATDAQIFEHMLDSQRPVTRFRSSFATLVR